MTLFNPGASARGRPVQLGFKTSIIALFWIVLLILVASAVGVFCIATRRLRSAIRETDRAETGGGQRSTGGSG